MHTIERKDLPGKTTYAIYKQNMSNKIAYYRFWTELQVPTGVDEILAASNYQSTKVPTVSRAETKSYATYYHNKNLPYHV